MAGRNLDPKEAAFVAHPAHVYRVMAIANKLGIEGFPFISNDVWWPKNDEQGCIRSSWKWAPREITARIQHTLKGWVSFSGFWFDEP